MLPHIKLSSEDVAECHGSQEPLDSPPQKKCSVTSFLKEHAFILLTVLGIAIGECFQKHSGKYKHLIEENWFDFNQNRLNISCLDV